MIFPIKIRIHLITLIGFMIFHSGTFASCYDGQSISNIEKKEFLHNGLTREYIYYAPRNLKKGASLVVVLHGFTSSAEKIMDYSGFNKLADDNNFALIYPQGTKDKKANTFWNVGYTFHSALAVDDVDFIASLIRHMQDKYSLSKKNTFLTGMSNGGEMCYLLLCKHPKMFGAVAPVAGMMLRSFFEDCDSKNTVPLFAVFGTNDKVTNFNGDLKNKDGWGAYISIPSTIKYWTHKINHNKTVFDTIPDINAIDSSYIVSERYINSNTSKELKFFKIINGGHDWPGSWGNMDVDISKEIWSFFEYYTK